MTVVAYDETNVPFTYKGGQQGSDIYIKLSNGTTTVECCVSRYLRPSTTDTYKTIESLKVGDKVTVTAFLYWYNGANPQILSVTK